MNDSTTVAHIVLFLPTYCQTFEQKSRTVRRFPHYLHILIRLCGQNLNRNVCVALLFVCNRLNAVCICSGVNLCRIIWCVFVCVRDSQPLMYVPSFVSEDYSFPFEVRQLARGGRSERRPRAGFHTFPTAACRLGGKYVCRPKRQRETGARRQ